MNTLQHRIVAFLKKYESSSPELAQIFDAHPETIRRLLQESRDQGLIVPTGRWDGKAPCYRAKEGVEFDPPDVREYKRQVDDALTNLFSALHSRPKVPDVRIAIRSIVAAAVQDGI